jgi:hypothetical protein
VSVATDHLAFFRAQWGQRWNAEIKIDRITGRTAPNADGERTPTTAVVLAAPAPGTSNGLVRPASQMAIDRLAGQELERFAMYEIRVADTFTGLEIEDQVTVIALADDPELVGEVLIVRDWEGDSYVTNRLMIATLDLGQGVKV